MGTGIVSVTLRLHRVDRLSYAFMVLAAAAWLVLMALVIRSRPPRRQAGGPSRPSPADLSLVAATAVLGSRLGQEGLRWEPLALLGLALAVWLWLSPQILRGPPLRTGAGFMLTVAPQSLAVLAAGLGGNHHCTWLVVGAMVAWAIGLSHYPPALARFDFRQLAVGSGDQWVLGGALAISALAASEIGFAAARIAALGDLIPVLHTLAMVVWVAGMLWLPLLVLSEFAFPRPRAGLSRFSTVFPVGMYGACSFEAARIGGAAAVLTFARAWTWVAVAVWGLVAISCALTAARHMSH